jgi:hypothetical protein
MDMQIPDHPSSPTEPIARLSPAHVTHLLKALATANPSAAPADEEAQQDLRDIFLSLDPQNAADAQVAAIAIAAGQAAMDGFTRAARPGLSDDTAIRLRASAFAAGRLYLAAHRYFRKPKPKSANAKPKASEPNVPEPKASAPKPSDTPAAKPFVGVFNPRDRFGKPIPHWRRDLMTEAQWRATYTPYPPDPVLVAAALAEEEAMIAEQQALERNTLASPTGEGQVGGDQRGLGDPSE